MSISTTILPSGYTAFPPTPYLTEVRLCPLLLPFRPRRVLSLIESRGKRVVPPLHPSVSTLVGPLFQTPFGGKEYSDLAAQHWLVPGNELGLAAPELNK